MQTFQNNNLIPTMLTVTTKLAQGITEDKLHTMFDGYLKNKLKIANVDKFYEYCNKAILRSLSEDNKEIYQLTKEDWQVNEKKAELTEYLNSYLENYSLQLYLNDSLTEEKKEKIHSFEDEDLSFTYLTDKNIEEMSTYVEDGEEKIREITNPQIVNDKGEVPYASIFGDIFGTDKKERLNNYALVKSPIPLVAGREELIASVLKISSDIVESMAEGDNDYLYNSETKFFEINKNNKENNIYFGLEALEKALSDLTPEDACVNTYIKMLSAQESYLYFNEQSIVVKGEDYLDKEEIKKRKAAIIKKEIEKRERDFAIATNTYISVSNFLLNEGNLPKDLLLHNFLITPPGTRPINDINETINIGEYNDALISMVSSLTYASASYESMDKNKKTFWEKQIYNNHKKCNEINDKEFILKDGLAIGRLKTNISNRVVRGVANPHDFIKEQEEFQKKGIDCLTMDFISIPISSARIIYKTEIEEILKKTFHLTPEEIIKEEAETGENNIYDKALNIVLDNNGKGKVGMFLRDPTISPNSIHTAYVCVHDGDNILLDDKHSKSMNLDYDGDTILFVPIEDEDRNIFIKQMQRNVVDDATGDILLLPKEECLATLYEVSKPAVTSVKEKYPVKFVRREEGNIGVRRLLAKLKTLKEGIKVGDYCVPGEIIGYNKNGEPYKADRLVYVDTDGKAPLVFDQFVKTYITDKDAVVNTKEIVSAGEELFHIEPKRMVKDEYLVDELKTDLLNGDLAYNSPLIFKDGTLTTPSRVILNSCFPQSMKFELKNDITIDKNMLNGIYKKSLLEDTTIEEIRKSCNDITDFGTWLGTMNLVPSSMLYDLPYIEEFDVSSIYKIVDRDKQAEVYNSERDKYCDKAFEILKEHDSRLWAAYQSGTIKKSALKDLLATPLVKDRNGKYYQIAGGNTVRGVVALKRLIAEAMVPKLGDKTQDIGIIGFYTNKLTASTQGMYLVEGDCGTNVTFKEELPKTEEELNKKINSLDGKMVGEDIRSKGKNKNPLVKKGEYLTKDTIKKLVKNGVEYVNVRSPLGCACPGTCTCCLGKSKKIVAMVGDNIGTRAALSCTEGSKQAGLDIAKNTNNQATNPAEQLEKLITAEEIRKLNEKNPIKVALLLKQYFKTLLSEDFPDAYIDLLVKSKIFVLDEQNNVILPLSKAIENGIDKYSNSAFIAQDPANFLSLESTLLTVAKYNKNKFDASAPMLVEQAKTAIARGKNIEKEKEQEIQTKAKDLYRNNQTTNFIDDKKYRGR